MSETEKQVYHTAFVYISDVSKQDVEEYFNRLCPGDVADVRMPSKKNRVGLPVKYAFVNFRTRAALDKVLEQPIHTIGNKECAVEKSNSTSRLRNPPAVCRC
eukprot:jgi/Botrbrau1/23682/Bobra.55_2s0062.2